MGKIGKILSAKAAVTGTSNADHMSQDPQMRGPFHVADLDARGDLRSKAVYTYEQLEQVVHAGDLITAFSTNLWRSPEGFDLNPLSPGGHVEFRCRAVAQSAGIATLRWEANLASVSLL